MWPIRALSIKILHVCKSRKYQQEQKVEVMCIYYVHVSSFSQVKQKFSDIVSWSGKKVNVVPIIFLAFSFDDKQERRFSIWVAVRLVNIFKNLQYLQLFAKTSTPWVFCQGIGYHVLFEESWPSYRVEKPRFSNFCRARKRFRISGQGELDFICINTYKIYKCIIILIAVIVIFHCLFTYIERILAKIINFIP